jgi:hypothetical protein
MARQQHSASFDALAQCLGHLACIGCEVRGSSSTNSSPPVRNSMSLWRLRADMRRHHRDQGRITCGVAHGGR